MEPASLQLHPSAADAEALPAQSPTEVKTEAQFRNFLGQYQANHEGGTKSFVWSADLHPLSVSHMAVSAVFESLYVKTPIMLSQISDESITNLLAMLECTSFKELASTTAVGEGDANTSLSHLDKSRPSSVEEVDKLFRYALNTERSFLDSVILNVEGSIQKIDREELIPEFLSSLVGKSVEGVFINMRIDTGYFGC